MAIVSHPLTIPNDKTQYRWYLGISPQPRTSTHAHMLNFGFNHFQSDLRRHLLATALSVSGLALFRELAVWCMVLSR